ncbi:hypothetical protein EON80_21050 [bacterium]|nr:MAG: hypothetical protein EON80_21050 [bacterium]
MSIRCGEIDKTVTVIGAEWLKVGDRVMTDNDREILRIMELGEAIYQYAPFFLDSWRAESQAT